MAKTANIGTCHLCLAEAELSFEHFPPKAAGNNRKVVSMRWGDWFRPGKWSGRGPQDQRGAGAHTLCRDCNSKLGRWYVNEYVAWARCGRQILAQAPVAANGAEIDVLRSRPLRFLKEVIAMFMSANSLPFARLHRDLAEFVLDRDARGLPGRYQVFMSLVRGQYARSVGLAGQITPNGPCLYTEVAFPPFAFIMTVDSPSAWAPGCITHFGRFEYDERADVTLAVAVGEVFSMYPGDYRRASTFLAATR